MAVIGRVTQYGISKRAGQNLQTSLARSEALQEMLSSGRQLNRPSDSPTGTVKSLQYRTSIRRSEQFLRNAGDGLDWLNTADNALQHSLSVTRRVRDLTLQGGNAALGPNDREALAKEVEALRDEAISLANSKVLGRPVFGGTATPAPGAPDVAYTSAGAYVGNSGSVVRNITDGVTVPVNLTGPEVFGPAGNDLFTAMTQIAADLRTNPAALAATDLGALDQGYARLQFAVSTIGARTNQIETLKDRVTQERSTQQMALSEVESADLPQTIMDLQVQEVAYQAALAATSRVIQPSLTDFLR